MITIRRRSVPWNLLRVPVHLYRWHLGWLFGRRCLLLTHIGRRTDLRRQTVLEVVEYRTQGPEVVVANGFGLDCDWVRNIEAHVLAGITVGLKHFVASHRYLGEEEAVSVIRDYEHRNRWIAPIVRRGFSWLLGWRYRGSEDDRRRLVRQIPLIAFRARIEQEQFGRPLLRHQDMRPHRSARYPDSAFAGPRWSGPAPHRAGTGVILTMASCSPSTMNRTDSPGLRPTRSRGSATRKLMFVIGAMKPGISLWFRTTRLFR